MPDKTVRTICFFSRRPGPTVVEEIERLSLMMENRGFDIQTKRICAGGMSVAEIDAAFPDETLYLSVGTLNRSSARAQLDDFLSAGNVAFNVDLSDGVGIDDTALLFAIIRRQPSKTFNFTHTFRNVESSPYFPSASYGSDGFAVGLQPTDLAADCRSLEEWFDRMRAVWDEILSLFRDETEFLGIDSSIASLFEGRSSFVNFVNRVSGDFAASASTDLYLRISEFIVKHNPRPVGLCRLMFPCLEDFELAREYEAGRFSIERNIFLSLHSGLGVDTYPIGIDESPNRVLEILNVLQRLSRRYDKPLSARFVSDGRARIGDRSDFGNQYLKDVVIRPL